MLLKSAKQNVLKSEFNSSTVLCLGTLKIIRFVLNKSLLTAVACAVPKLPHTGKQWSMPSFV